MSLSLTGVHTQELFNFAFFWALFILGKQSRSETVQARTLIFAQKQLWPFTILVFICEAFTVFHDSNMLMFVPKSVMYLLIHNISIDCVAVTLMLMLKQDQEDINYFTVVGTAVTDMMLSSTLWLVQENNCLFFLLFFVWCLCLWIIWQRDCSMDVWRTLQIDNPPLHYYHRKGLVVRQFL